MLNNSQLISLLDEGCSCSTLLFGEVSSFSSQHSVSVSLLKTERKNVSKQTNTNYMTENYLGVAGHLRWTTRPPADTFKFPERDRLLCR